jgi:hypothetical protein
MSSPAARADQRPVPAAVAEHCAQFADTSQRVREQLAERGRTLLAASVSGNARVAETAGSAGQHGHPGR